MAKVPATKAKVTASKSKVPATTKTKIAKISTTKTKVVPTVKAKKSPTKKLSPEKILSRNEKIQNLYSTGKYSIRALAAKVGLSKTRVGEIVI